MKTSSEVHAPVDHNIMRHINASKEMNSSINFEEENYEDDANDQYEIQTGTQSRKKKGIKINFETKPVPTMDEKINIREKMFLMLEESRINEMRVELDYELAKENGETDKAKQLAEELFEIQIRNAESLKDLITDYQPISVGKNWGNDSDYVDMLKHLATIGETPRSMPARKSIGEMHHVHRMNHKN
mmetsp:Transcript_22139/g.30369  ORF Transcript_22139/g.30369 Transcript_22139/m.30369 type:complete len:187 (+) Transcript_22139:3-563(+)